MNGALSLRRALARAAAIAGLLAPFAGSPYLRAASPGSTKTIEPVRDEGARPQAPVHDVGVSQPAPDTSASAKARRKGC